MIQKQHHDISPEDLEDEEDEQPTVVVLKSGDLTAEEAARAKLQLDKGEIFLQQILFKCVYDV